MSADKKSEKPVDSADFWQQRYLTGGDGWEMGEPAPPLSAYFRGPDAPEPGRVLVPGCGRGHEALLLAELGWDVVALDLAPAAVESATALAAERKLDVDVRLGDFFTLDEPAAYDAVVEHTLYCAIDPARRDQYADTVRTLLRPAGQFVGLFWSCGITDGPPWTCDPPELEERFGRRLQIERFGRAAGSFPRRAEQEWLMVARRDADDQVSHKS